jgi:large subunit ribosomal protein L5
MVARLEEKYKTEVAPALAAEFKRANRLAVPRLTKIVVSMGVGKFLGDEAKLDAAVAELAQITGQKPVVTKARGSISNFKLRQGMKVGIMVTLRGQRMYEFLDHLIALAIPRVKDFRGLPPSGFDGRGNYNMGLSEQTVFPEVDPAKVQFTQGMNITMVTTAATDEEARRLLTLLGMPFRT